MKKIKILFVIAFLSASLLGTIKLSTIKSVEDDSPIVSSNITFNWNYGVLAPDNDTASVTLFESDSATPKVPNYITAQRGVSKVKNSPDNLYTAGNIPITSKIYKHSDYSGRGPLSKDALEQCSWVGFWLNPGNYGTDILYPKYVNMGPVSVDIAAFYQSLGYDLSQGEKSDGKDGFGVQYQNDFWQYSANYVSKDKAIAYGYTIWLRVVPQMATIKHKTIFQSAWYNESRLQMM